MPGPADIVLVHGGMYDRRRWSLLAPELESRGHWVFATEHAGDDAGAGNAEFAAEVIAQMDTAEVVDDAVVAAHSMSGLFLPLIPGGREAGKLVFLCAPAPMAGKGFVERPEPSDPPRLPAADPTILTDDGEGRFINEEDAPRRLFCPDVDPAVASEAMSHLRPQAAKPHAEPSRVERWPSTPAISIRTTVDAVVTAEYSANRAAEVGMPLLELSGGHSPFRARPEALAEVLDGATGEA